VATTRAAKAVASTSTSTAPATAATSAAPKPHSTGATGVTEDVLAPDPPVDDAPPVQVAQGRGDVRQGADGGGDTRGAGDVVQRPPGHEAGRHPGAAVLRPPVVDQLHDTGPARQRQRRRLPPEPLGPGSRRRLVADQRPALGVEHDGRRPLHEAIVVHVRCEMQ
jgi:hypothetical protein